MKQLKQILCLVICLCSLDMYGQKVTTIAGNGVGYSDGPANLPRFSNSYKASDLAIDANDNIYVSDNEKNKIFKITPTGVVTTLAGSGLQGSGDGNGLIATFNSPQGLAVDDNGNVYVADAGNHKIRKISPSGVVSTLAGSGTAGNIDGIGTAASFKSPRAICLDVSGNIYVSDKGNHKIRKISPSGVVSTLAGSGTAGNKDGIASASFNSPNEITINARGDLYVADGGNNKIREISPTGGVSTYAGNGEFGSIDGDGFKIASFDRPEGIKIDKNGNLYITDLSSNKIRKINSSRIVSTIAGSGTSSSSDGIGTSASFISPRSLALDSKGNIYVTENKNNFRKITPSGVVTTFDASFNEPSGVVVDANGNVYVADRDNHIIRKISPTGLVSTFAGNGTKGNTDGAGNVASFSSPQEITIDATGNLYVADRDNFKIRKISPTGLVSTFAGNGTQGNTDGAGNVASFSYLNGITIDASGNLYVTESNHKIRKITPTGLVSTFAGNGTQGNTDGAGHVAMFSSPQGITIDVAGNLYVADRDNYKIRKITPNGVVTTFAGNGKIGGNDGIGSVAGFFNLRSITIDIVGNLYVAERYIIRKITPSGVVSTIIAGNAVAIIDGIGNNASFSSVNSLSIDNKGNLFLSDVDYNSPKHNTIRIIEPLDDDNDGVKNTFDYCDKTPVSELSSIDAKGCSISQRDSDNDGIKDNIDICTNTPLSEKATVNSKGCSISQRDTDTDGINDNLDICSNTPLAEIATVNAQGCSISQRDSDGDGIKDNLDSCVNTPISEKATINSKGCSISQRDTDNDGINDKLDLCANTLLSEIGTVNTQGCSISQQDSDSDGISNGSDICPNTPLAEKATVNAQGCSSSQRDTDNDGITDNLDICSNTPTAEIATVNAQGCSISQRDTDGDGRKDNIDVCINTPLTEKYLINSSGCGPSERDTDSDGLKDDVDLCDNTPLAEIGGINAQGCSFSEQDADNDGIANKNDICANTPLAEKNTVNGQGCSASQRDTDGDGVTDNLDICSGTSIAEKATVNAQGCAASQRDTDGDGVTDNLDICANTLLAEKTTVNAQGCAASQRDTDNDGVTDNLDICANTPVGEKGSLNLQGCSASQRDTDGDGLKDNVDLCVNTPLSEIGTINAQGCSASEIDTDGDGVKDNLDKCNNTNLGIVYNQSFNKCWGETFVHNGITVTDPGIYNVSKKTSTGCDSTKTVTYQYNICANTCKLKNNNNNQVSYGSSNCLNLTRVDLYNIVTGPTSNPNNYLGRGQKVRIKIFVQNSYTQNLLTLKGILKSKSPYVTITDSIGAYNNIIAGQGAWTVDEFEFIINPNAPDNHNAVFELKMDDEISTDFTWYSYMQIPVTRFEITKVVIDDDNIPDSNGDNDDVAEPNESIEIIPLLANKSSDIFYNAQGTLLPATNYINIWNNKTGASGTVLNTYSLNKTGATWSPIQANQTNILPELDYVFDHKGASVFKLNFNLLVQAYYKAPAGSTWSQGGELFKWMVPFAMNNGAPFELAVILDNNIFTKTYSADTTINILTTVNSTYVVDNVKVFVNGNLEQNLFANQLGQYNLVLNTKKMLAGSNLVTIEVTDANGNIVTINKDLNVKSTISTCTTTVATQPSLLASKTSIASGESVTLTASGTLNCALAWKWYTSACGGTLVGTGNSITVKPTVSTVYYARGEGGSITPGACGTISIQVNQATYGFKVTKNGIAGDGTNVADWVKGRFSAAYIPSGSNASITAPVIDNGAVKWSLTNVKLHNNIAVKISDIAPIPYNLDLSNTINQKVAIKVKASAPVSFLIDFDDSLFASYYNYGPNRPTVNIVTAGEFKWYVFDLASKFPRSPKAVSQVSIQYVSATAFNGDIWIDEMLVGEFVPTISKTGSLASFVTNANTPSKAQSLTVSGSALIDLINVNATSGYEITTDTLGVWSSQLQVSGTNAKLFVRAKAQSASNALTGNLTLTSTAAVSVNVPLSGVVVNGIEDELWSDKIQLIPNPVIDFLEVISLQKSISNYTIYSSVGEIVLSNTNWIESEKIDVRDLPSGMYMIKVADNEKAKIMRFIKY